MKKYLFLLVLLLALYFLVGILFYQFRLAESLTMISQDISYDIANHQIWNAEKRLNMVKQFGFSDLEIQKIDEYNFRDNSCLLKYSKPLTIDGLEVARIVNCASLSNILHFVFKTQWLGIIFVAFFFFAFVSFTYPLLAYKNKVQKFINNYNSAEDYSALMNDSVLSKVINIIQNNLIYQQKINELQIQAERQSISNQISKQVAHDIRSPLSALNMITSALDEVPSDKQELIKSAIQRINDIANDLLKKSKQAASSDSDLFSQNSAASLLIFPIIESIVSEKRIQFKNIENVEILSDPSNSHDLFCSINESELKRVLSNLINNSVEAFKAHHGKVILKLSKIDNFALVTIEDDGPGIPLGVLEKLGLEAVSHGKENTESGNGIGVLHAKRTIEKFNGTFKIESNFDKGTKVSILLPLAQWPSWFLNKINLNKNSLVIVCDDDISIHSLWRKNVSETTENTLFFSSINTLDTWLTSHSENDFILLIDYEFRDSTESGLDFIIRNNLNSKSILVTSHYDEEIVIRTCIEHGIKQIPKNICALVPIEMTSAKSIYDAVVLDNEDLQVRSWQFAAIQKGKTILVFSKHEDFLAALSDIDHKTPIFIDSILGDTIKGEDIAKQVFDQGFKNVYMSSGHDPSYFKDMTFLKGVIGKTPFFP